MHKWYFNVSKNCRYEKYNTYLIHNIPKNLNWSSKKFNSNIDKDHFIEIILNLTLRLNGIYPKLRHL